MRPNSYFVVALVYFVRRLRSYGVSNLLRFAVKKARVFLIRSGTHHLLLILVIYRTSEICVFIGCLQDLKTTLFDLTRGVKKLLRRDLSLHY